MSFYRGKVSSDLPKEVARKRKEHENQWLATLPLKLPVSHISHLIVALLLPGSFFSSPSPVKTDKVPPLAPPQGNCSEVSPPRLFPPALNSENNFNLGEGQYPPLNLGDPENGLLTEDNLVCISRQIGREWQEIGLSLGLTYTEVEHINHNNKSVSRTFF